MVGALPAAFIRKTPIGDNYGWDQKSPPTAFSPQPPSPSSPRGANKLSGDTALLTALDQARDDGNLNTGSVRRGSTHALVSIIGRCTSPFASRSFNSPPTPPRLSRPITPPANSPSCRPRPSASCLKISSGSIPPTSPRESRVRPPPPRSRPAGHRTRRNQHRLHRHRRPIPHTRFPRQRRPHPHHHRPFRVRHRRTRPPPAPDHLAKSSPARVAASANPASSPPAASSKSSITTIFAPTTSSGIAPPFRPEFFRRHRSAPRQRRVVRRNRHACHTVGISPTCHGTRAAIRISSAPQSTRRVITT